MLCENYFTYEMRANQSGGSSHCHSCSLPDQVEKPVENLVHIISKCVSYDDIRNRILPEYSLLCQQSKSRINFADIFLDKNKLCQFVLDPGSLNLNPRISQTDPLLEQFFVLSRDLCHAIHKRRLKILKEKTDQENQKKQQ